MKKELGVDACKIGGGGRCKRCQGKVGQSRADCEVAGLGRGGHLGPWLLGDGLLERGKVALIFRLDGICLAFFEIDFPVH